VLAGLGLAPGNPAASTEDPCWNYMRILMDTDKDGTVTRAEFDALWAGYFTKSDTNGDGNLDAGELHSEELARGLDSNQDGKLDRDEFVAPINPLFEPDSGTPTAP
jgi:Ca2+-binding EF-hand superfamily protein